MRHAPWYLLFVIAIAAICVVYASQQAVQNPVQQPPETSGIPLTTTESEGTAATTNQITPPESPDSESPTPDPATTQTADPATTNPKSPKLPGYEIDLEAKEVRMDAEICLSQGILEYLVCMPNTFEHEAIFVTKAKPEYLHLALLLIGMKPFPLRNPLWWMQHPKQSESQLRVQVEWEEAGQTARVDLHKMLVSRAGEEGDEYDYPMQGEAPPERDEAVDTEVADSWVFAGSFFYEQDGKNTYAANVDGVIIAIWPMSSSVVQYGKQTENPYHGENFGLAVNSELCPAIGTKVKLVFSPRPEPEKASTPSQ